LNVIIEPNDVILADLKSEHWHRMWNLVPLTIDWGPCWLGVLLWYTNSHTSLRSQNKGSFKYTFSRNLLRHLLRTKLWWSSEFQKLLEDMD